MNVIVFASRKGGSGKSTLTAHLAAHANRPSRRCMLIDCDPQGSISLWHKLRGTAEPQLRNGARGGIKEIVEQAQADGVEWAFVDTPPNMSGAVTDAISVATLVVIPVRLAVFDLAAVKETIDFARQSKKPFALVINAVPPRRDNTESPFVTQVREVLAGPERAGVGRADHASHDLFALARIRRGCEGIRRGFARRRRDREPVGRDRPLREGDPRRLCGCRDAPGARPERQSGRIHGRDFASAPLVCAHMRRSGMDCGLGMRFVATRFAALFFSLSLAVPPPRNARSGAAGRSRARARGRCLGQRRSGALRVAEAGLRGGVPPSARDRRRSSPGRRSRSPSS